MNEDLDSSNSSWATSGVGSDESYFEQMTGADGTNPMQLTTVQLDLSTASSAASKRKRQRLTHLTQDEKLQRRKLKNRVAAQSARDRKKARMEDLEVKVKQLADQNATLIKENDLLKENMRKLLDENRKLLNKHKQVKQEAATATATATTPSRDVNVLNANLPVVRSTSSSQVAGSAASDSSVSLPKKQLFSNKPSSQQSNWLLVAMLVLSTLSLASKQPNHSNSILNARSMARTALIKSKLRNKLTLINRLMRTKRRLLSVNMLKCVLRTTYPT